MKKAGMLIAGILLLTSFSMIVSAGLTSYTVENGSDTGDNFPAAPGGCGTMSPDGNDACCKSKGYTSWNDETGACENKSLPNNSIKPNRLTNEQLKKIIHAKNKITAEAKAGECPDNCTCTGSVVKCELENDREMTITAGKSGNIIVQVKGENMSTNVTLYKADEKIYGVFKNNETKEIKMLPDQVKEKLREKTAKLLEDEKITLNEDGTYKYEGKKKSKLFLFIPIKVKVTAEIDAETGEITKTSKPNWWEFLAKDEGNPIVGASCGTVSPDSRDECCKDKGYDLWDTEKGECVFNAS